MTERCAATCKYHISNITGIYSSAKIEFTFLETPKTWSEAGVSTTRTGGGNYTRAQPPPKNTIEK